MLLVPLLALATACQRPEEPAEPAELLSKPQMASLIAKLHLLETQVENSQLTADSARALFLEQERQLLQREGVTDSAFHRSYRYYGIHGKDLDDIYGVVIDSLGALERRLTPPAPAAPAPAPPAAPAK